MCFHEGVIPQFVLEVGLENVEQAIPLIALGVIRAFRTKFAVDVPVAIERCELASPVLQLDYEDSIVSHDDQVELHAPL
ncbi:hypothetical protein D3C84_1198980 [compost metagenome]